VTTADDILNHIDDALDDWTVSGDAMRYAPDAAGEPPEPPRLNVVIAIDTARIDEAFARIHAMWEGLKAWTEAVRPRLEEAGRSLADMGEVAQQAAAACDVHCKPPRPRDRPAWQSPYGPARRRR
jgi:hypothetical protein